MMSITEEQFFNFIRKSDKEVYEDPATYSYATKHYLTKFKAHSDKFFFSWNWAPFFFQEAWFVLRKMYFYALLSKLLFIYLCIGFIFVLEHYFSLEELKSSSLPLIIGIYYIFLPMMSDYLYIRWAKRMIIRNKLEKKGVSLGEATVFFIRPAAKVEIFVKM